MKASRSAGEAYETARFIEREVIAAGLADRCEAHVGVDEGGNPYLASLETYGTERIPRERIEELVNEELVKRRREWAEYSDHAPIIATFEADSPGSEG